METIGILKKILMNKLEIIKTKDIMSYLSDKVIEIIQKRLL